MHWPEGGADLPAIHQFKFRRYSSKGKRHQHDDEQAAIVTGASQGIGAKIVKVYRQLGFRVVATSRSIRPSEDENVMTVTGDIGDPATAQRVVAAAIACPGRVDTLVNVCSRPSQAPFLPVGRRVLVSFRAASR